MAEETPGRPTAERIVLGARLEPGGPERAFAVSRGRFMAVGPRDDVLALRDAGTAVEDLGGRRVIPGLHDAHCHLAHGAMEGGGLDLRGDGGPDAVAEHVRARAAALPDGAWIRGFGWDSARWAGARPSRAALDRAAPAHPVFLGRADGHAAWLNTAAFRALGVGVGEAPGFGARATEGVLEENAADEARSRIPRAPRRDRRALLGEALREAARLGLTSAEDVADPEALSLYLDLRGAGPLPLRAGVWLPLDLDEDEAEDCRERCADDPWLTVTTRKVFVDGTFGGRSAALEHPYAGGDGGRGELRVDPGELARKVREADARGWAVAFHAVGDRALAVVLDALDVLPRRVRARPHRIEHAQAVRRVDLPRIARTGAAISVQPLHWRLDRTWAAAGVPVTDGTILYAWRSLRQVSAGGFAVGTDWPVASLDPLETFRAAAARRTDVTEVESLDEEEILGAYTAGSAAAAGLASDRGRIAPGCRADYLVLEGDGGVEEGLPSARRYLDGTPASV